MGKTEDVGSVQGNRGPGGGVLDGTTQPSWREDGAVGVGRNSEVREASGVAYSRTW